MAFSATARSRRPSDKSVFSAVGRGVCLTQTTMFNVTYSFLLTRAPVPLRYTTRLKHAGIAAIAAPRLNEHRFRAGGMRYSRGRRHDDGEQDTDPARALPAHGGMATRRHRG